MFRDKEDEAAYWEMVRENNANLFARLERERRKHSIRRFCIFLAVLGGLWAFGYFFGPL